MFGLLLVVFILFVVIVAVTQASKLKPAPCLPIYLSTKLLYNNRTSENAIQQPQSHYLRAWLEMA
ncbi:hypothetical protein FVEN_g13064 [Fusarium venenatum]|nr:hypothetical protein FVEN_g13064 [Fusarium venenatum]